MNKKLCRLFLVMCIFCQIYIIQDAYADDIFGRFDFKSEPIYYVRPKLNSINMYNNQFIITWDAIEECDGYIIDPFGAYVLLDKMPELVEKVNKSLKSSTNVKKKNEYTNSQFIKEVQEALGANVDGIAGNETLSKTITVSNKTNRKHKVVKALQKEFARLGYTEVGNVDGVAGVKFKSAVIHFQKDNGCKQDGIITKGNKTWKKLLGMEV